MRKFFTSAMAVFLLGNFAQAQAPRVVPAHLAKAEKLQMQVDAEKIAQSEARLDASAVLPSQDVSLGVSSVVSTRIGTATNSFTYIDNCQNQVAGLPGVGTNGGTATFIFRKRVTDCGGSSGSLMYNISTDGGTTWQGSTTGPDCFGVASLNPDLTFLGRYPEQVTFGKSVSDLKMVYAGPTLPTTAGASWAGDALFGLAQDISNPAGPTVTQEDYVNGGIANIYRAESMVKRGDKDEFWAIVPLAAPSDGDSAFDIYKGVYNPSSGSVGWAIKQHVSLATYANQVDGFSIFQTVMAFSKDGSIGYIAFLGDLVGAKDSVYLPCVMEFNAATEEFGEPYEITSKMSSVAGSPDNMLYDSLTNYIKLWTDSTGTSLTTNATFSRMDLEIDSRGVPHLLCAVMPGFDPTAGDPAYSYYPGFGGRIIDLTKDASCEWNVNEIAAIYRFKDDIGTGTDAMQFSCNPYISASEDRRFFFYTWSDADTSTNLADVIGQPNVVGMVYDTKMMMMSDTTNWTYGDATWGGFGRFPKAATTALDRGNGTFHVPTTVLRFPDQTLANAPAVSTDFYYFSNIEYNTAAATFGASWIMPAGTGPACPDLVAVAPASNINNLKVYPNPAAAKANISLDLKAADDVTIELVGLNGQVITARTIKGATVVDETINVDKLAAGIYLVKVTTSKGIATEKLIVE